MLYAVEGGVCVVFAVCLGSIHVTLWCGKYGHIVCWCVHGDERGSGAFVYMCVCVHTV